MGQLVIQQPGNLGITTAQHRVEYGVRKPPQRRVRSDATDEHVVTPRREPGRKLPRLLFAEPAPICSAAGDRVAPRPGLERELRRSEHVPDHRRPFDIGVMPVALRRPQSEFQAPEQQCVIHHQQFPTHGFGRCRVGQHLFQRLAGSQERRLPSHGLEVIPRATGRDCGRKYEHCHRSL